MSSPGMPADLSFGQTFSEITLAATLAWTGEWYGVFRLKGANQIAVGADHFGYAQLFYSEFPDPTATGSRTVLVSPSFRGILAARRLQGQTNKLRFDIALPSLISTNNIFRTRASDESFADGVFVLGNNDLLVLDENGFGVIERPAAVESNDYDALIGAGIDRAVGVIQSSIESGKPVQFSLSGGKDSRAVLGLLVAAGAERDVHTWTQIPSGPVSASQEIFSRDFVTASRLVQRFDLRWWAPEPSDASRVSFEDDLSYWQNYRSNGSFEFVAHETVARPVERIGFVGIGGELVRSYLGAGYRTSLPGWWSKAGKVDDSVERDLRSLFRAICPSWLIGRELYESSEASFVRAFSLEDGQDVIAQIDASYLAYRNRCHAGTAAFQRPLGPSIVYPLAQPEFVAANRLLERVDREDGRVLFDILERTMPDLNALPFVSPPWTDRFATTGSKSSWSGYSGALRRDELRASKLGSSIAPPRVVTGAPRRAFVLDGGERAFENLGIMADHLRMDDWDVDGFLSRVSRILQYNEKMLRVVLAASETARDVLETPIVRLRVRDLDFRTWREDFYSLSGARVGGIAASDSSTVLLRKHIDQVDLSGVTATVQVVEGDACRNVIVSTAGLRLGSEAACYLHVDGRRIDTQWYSQSGVFEFVVDEQLSGTVRAEVFVRWVGDPVVQRVFDVPGILPAAGPVSEG
ncbi:hypothetical protein [Oerskovia sp. Root22]|uniref:hypothetical protein n=1 Tax=Oerskovia sp. Root22 TaxID=1736494 RepID=UPI00138EFD22|nr:hypothetical protein [Oerskovia sp. Root22]